LKTLLEYFSTNDSVALLESDLPSLVGEARLSNLIALAWQLRQRDPKRSMGLADDALRLLDRTPIDDVERQRVLARIRLIHAEIKWLHCEMVISEELAEGALNAFTQSGDMLGCIDARFLLADLAFDLGENARRASELETIISVAVDLDPVRLTLAQASVARALAFFDAVAAKSQWDQVLAIGRPDRHAVEEFAIEDFWGVISTLESDHVQNIRHMNTAFLKALTTGQIRRAIYAALNVGESYLQLNDYQAAMEWTQRAQDLARRSTWPGMIGNTLGRMANILRRLHRFDAAAKLLHEALEMMAPVAGSRNYAIALHFLGQVQLDRKEFGLALETLRQLEKLATMLNQADLLCDALCGQAKALSELGDPEAAHLLAQRALQSTNAGAFQKIAALRMLAEIHTLQARSISDDSKDKYVSLRYLQQAMDLARAVENYTIPNDLLDAMAREHAKLGDTATAYAMAMEANAAREKIHNDQVTNRASAMQIAHETEKVRAQAEQHRLLAQESLERATVLEHANVALSDQLVFKSEELERVDSNLSQVRADLEKAYPMAMMASAIPGVAHDLNTPVGNMKLAASSMREKLGIFQEKVSAGSLKRSDLEAFLTLISEGLKIIEHANAKADELVGNLKELSIDQASQRRRIFDIDKIVDEVLVMLAPTLKSKHIQVMRDIPVNLTMDSFPGPLGQIIANLVQNAVVHGFDSKPHGIVMLQAEVIPDGLLRLFVRDNGVGMSEEIRARVFDQFFTTKQQRGGSGVGLALCRKLVEETLSGSITVESEEGNGSQFIITIPQIAPHLENENVGN
jgi:signal transduction histidine kinase